jgi:hypothetical protein
LKKSEMIDDKSKEEALTGISRLELKDDAEG